MIFYGIKTPETKTSESIVYWIGVSSNDSWNLFFKQSNPTGFRGFCKAAMTEAIRAYESIGYKCIELNVAEQY